MAQPKTVYRYPQLLESKIHVFGLDAISILRGSNLIGYRINMHHLIFRQQHVSNRLWLMMCQLKKMWFSSGFSARKRLKRSRKMTLRYCYHAAQVRRSHLGFHCLIKIIIVSDLLVQSINLEFLTTIDKGSFPVR